MSAYQPPAAEPFQSILFLRPDRTSDPAQLEEPSFFADLNLGQVVESITDGREEYDLTPFFYAPLDNVDAIAYRHEVLRDLQDTSIRESVTSFAHGMQSMRKHLQQARELHYRYQREHWFLDAVAIYCDAVRHLADDLERVGVRSRGLLALSGYLAQYAASEQFTALLEDTPRVRQQLAEIRYCVHVKGNRVKVSGYDSEADYSGEVLDTFEKFKQGDAKDRRVKLSEPVHMNHVEATVLNKVALLYPAAFTALDEYCAAHRDYVDDTIARFDRDVQFYLAYLDYMTMFERAGLSFCYPHVSEDSKEGSASETFDLALANKLVHDRSSVVCNDFYLRDPERIFVVSGPNQGGKTTFARTFGQLHYLASLGCLVPGTEVHLFLYDQLFTHFEREEDITDLRGKLQDDLVRIHDILEHATPRSIVIMNEIFTSTTLEDARFLGTKVLEAIVQLDALSVCVTFVDELTRVSDTTVSMVSTVVPDDPAVRTYKVVRRPADGIAYAAAIAEKHGLTYERLKGRIGA